MYFKKLELVGFKSFYDKTTLYFEPGITAVVGPNGTGKSNIFDSIRWVMGEQSIKALRGSQMQDVIFNGTDSKEPLGMAEVTLVFDNTNRFFNVYHDEVAITRRIFRSGESEYLLNKNPVRLKDILDLFMGTGIGAESYSLVAQGKIDLVLSSRPEDRRLVFDEASGITKYKAHKRETLHKLEDTEQNLLRVNDIISEVKRQIGSLERQANKARRYQEVFTELKSKEINLALLQKRGLLKQREEIIQELEELETEEVKLLQTIQVQESKTSTRQIELKSLEDNILEIKNETLNLDNLLIRDKQHFKFNQERTVELETNRKYLETQIQQIKNKLLLDEEKLNNLKEEHSEIKKNIAEKSLILKEKEKELNTLILSLRVSGENITAAKKEVLELVSKITGVKNEVTDSQAKQQIYSARKNRLQLEKAEVGGELSATEDKLKGAALELESLNKTLEGLSLKMSNLKDELAQEVLSLDKINLDIEDLEKQRLTLDSHREFIDKLKNKYENIDEAMNAVIYLDKLPKEDMGGLVIKIKDQINLSDEDKAYFEPASFKLSGEAKPIDLDTQKISERIAKLDKDLGALENIKIAKEERIKELKILIQDLGEKMRYQDIALANKQTSYQTVCEQLNKIKEEEEIIVLELADVEKEISTLEEKIRGLKISQAELEKRQKVAEDIILNEQNNLTANSSWKENVLVMITQTKTELDALLKRIDSDQATLKIWEDTYQQDEDNLANMERRVQELETKKTSLGSEMGDLENKINQTLQLIERQKDLLKGKEESYRKISDDSRGTGKRIEEDRRELDGLKNKLYELQMRNKDVDFAFLTLKDRISQGYKTDLETIVDIPEGIDENTLCSEIQRLKERLDSLGTVNLVAIEEYDELKKRYDFLVQQQNDLLKAKDSLREVILKINRITRKMFLETFGRLQEEFRNYFRLLFNGGDAQVFLIDEQDPLESGIEIICRPPGKKLQNVLLLSGGEKSLSAIALIFAIFKVKPSPFSILDEIDAALDEANVDRFSALLQEFAKESQFIVITHNKRTIVNADVMYGITMEESGLSKIVSVKFAKDNEIERVEVAEPV